MTSAEYLQALRDLAQSVLAGVQRLEDLGATADDETFSMPTKALSQADSDVWALVDWIDGGRADL
jgi:hypothetical protein